jgi:RND family efflux transporter MFP subunit
VIVTKIAAKDVDVEVRAAIELRPIAQADVGSKTLGVLDAVLVDRGDKVKKGQLLALVRPSDLPDQLAASRGTLAQIQAQITLARANYERAKQLAPSGIVSQQELANAQGALAQAEAAQAAAQAQAGAIATRLGETRILAPMDGVVSLRRLDPGAMVGSPNGGSILTVVQTEKLRVIITVTEKNAAQVKTGQPARVELEALPGKRIEGQVVRVAPTLDPTTRTLDAEVHLTNEKEEMRPGMFGHGAIVVETHPKVPIVPVGAMMISEGKRFVYVLTGDKVQRREIQTGYDEGTWLEVKSGLKEGDEVVVAGMDGLADGAPVRVARNVDPYTGKVLGSASAAPPPSSALAPPSGDNKRN